MVYVEFFEEDADNTERMGPFVAVLLREGLMMVKALDEEFSKTLARYKDGRWHLENSPASYLRAGVSAALDVIAERLK